MWRTAISWLHLCIMVFVVVVANGAQLFLRTFYRLFPFPSLLDRIWGTSAAVRRLFALRLGGDERSEETNAAELARSAGSIITSAGWAFEDNCVTTDDGYVLGVHRILPQTTNVGTDAWPTAHGEPSHTRVASVLAAMRGKTDLRVATGAGDRGGSGLLLMPDDPTVHSGYGHADDVMGRPPVLLMHGLMQCSEVWLVGDSTSSLAFALASAGYDVWLGNNRGNKYSQKHLTKHSDSDEFWDFCIDDFARYDIPAMVKYITERTGYERVAYIGFSQGTAQCFASLSLHPWLNDRLSVFVALSPALAVKGLSRSPITALVESNLSFIYLLFGRRRMLPSTLDVQRIMSGRAWCDFIDACLTYLFGWSAAGIDPAYKMDAFHRLYSFTSVKSVLHWFQLIASGRFAMFQDVPRATSILSGSLPFISSASIYQHRVPPAYDTRKIRIPMVMLAGCADTLIDIPRLVSLLPPLSAPVPMPAARATAELETSTLSESSTVTAAGPVVTHHLVSPRAAPPPATAAFDADARQGHRRLTSTRGRAASSSTLQALASVMYDAVGGYESPRFGGASDASLATAALPSPLPEREDEASTVDMPSPDDIVWQRQRLQVHTVDEWEHLDSIWGRSAPRIAFPVILATLQRYAHLQCIPPTCARAAHNHAMERTPAFNRVVYGSFDGASVRSEMSESALGMLSLPPWPRAAPVRRATQPQSSSTQQVIRSASTTPAPPSITSPVRNTAGTEALAGMYTPLAPSLRTPLGGARASAAPPLEARGPPALNAEPARLVRTSSPRVTATTSPASLRPASVRSVASGGGASLTSEGGGGRNMNGNAQPGASILRGLLLHSAMQLPAASPQSTGSGA